MVDEETLNWANARPEYQVTHMRDEAGELAPHYRDELDEHGLDFDALMADARFAEVIANEVAAEAIADANLSLLAPETPDERTAETFLRWLALVNADLQPWTTGGAIHFRPHWSRVLVLALTLGRQLDLSDADLEALSMAAVFHDSRRKNPYLDTGHGARGARYYADFCRDTAHGVVRRSPAGRNICFDPRTYLAIYWHDRNDDAGLAAIEEVLRTNAIPELGIGDARALLPEDAQASFETVYLAFKDCDALDRVRLGRNELDPRFLRNPESHGLIPFANQLLAVSSLAE